MIWTAWGDKPRRRETEFLGHTIVAEGRFIGSDLLVALYGGNTPHIGAAALAEPYQKGERHSVCASVLCAYGHREADVAKEAALALAKGFRTRVTVVCGIHFDCISQADISKVAQLAHELAVGLAQQE